MPESEYAVEIFPLAESDLESIYGYYFKESAEAAVAARVTGELKNAITGLAFMPKSHAAASERRLKKDGFRKLICGDFVIPFLIDEQRRVVSVVRVFHGKMNYKKYL